MMETLYIQITHHFIHWLFFGILFVLFLFLQLKNGLGFQLTRTASLYAVVCLIFFFSHAVPSSLLMSHHYDTFGSSAEQHPCCMHQTIAMSLQAFHSPLLSFIGKSDEVTLLTPSLTLLTTIHNRSPPPSA